MQDGKYDFTILDTMPVQVGSVEKGELGCGIVGRWVYGAVQMANMALQSWTPCQYRLAVWGKVSWGVA